MGVIKNRIADVMRKAYNLLPFRIQRFLLPLKKNVYALLYPRLGHAKKKYLFRDSRDISWAQFENTVLSRRHEFKGVFIQMSGIDWDVPLYQRPQHMCTALGKLGYLVIYHTNNRSFDDVHGAREIGANLWLTDCADGVAAIPDAIRSVYSTGGVRELQEMTAARAAGPLIYEYIDHIDPTISGADRVAHLARVRDFAFEGAADCIVASARVLEGEALELRPREQVIYVPNGVDCSHYRQDWSAQPLPQHYQDFIARHCKIVGYFGAMAPWLWYDMLAELIALRSDYGFVFIGPDYFGGSERLPKADNVLWLGAVDYKVLPAYAQAFDVALIPFEPGDVARTTSPLKLFEYFAMEVPVVVTDAMDECKIYDQVLTAGSGAEFAAAIDAALERAGDPRFKTGLRALADEHDWLARARTMEQAFRRLNPL